MSFDRTEHQSNDDRQQARELSLEPARPPAVVPGYKIQNFLGSGAFGEVWSATDLKTSRRVAIKFYTRRNRSDVQMLAREVEKLVVLEADRYVVQLLDVGWDADPPYFVMEFIEHGSLEDRLKNGYPMQVSEAIDLFKEIATGMMHLHRKGIFHCDLKPGNILLDQDGHPRVADFGQSRLSTDDTPALGTLFFMAPEQADMTAVPDASWDVYSLGCLLHSMLTGKPPYYSSELSNQIETTDDIGERLNKYRDSLLKAAPPTIHRQTAGVDRSLADLIDRCIAADPKQRFNSIESVLAALEAREVAHARRPLMLLGLFGPMLLLAIFGLFGYWAFNQAKSRADEAVTKKAQDSNTYTAKMAARTAAGRIDDYFRAVNHWAHEKSFVAKFQLAMENESLAQLRRQLADPNDNRSLNDLRAKYRNHVAIKPLLREVEKRLEDKFDEYPTAASWFVCDRMGNQIASAFPGENNTLGKNFAYRSYFTGLPRDLEYSTDPEKNEVPPAAGQGQTHTRTIISAPHLSGVFLSQQSKTWKVAFSSPILDAQGETLGIVAITAELGRMVDFIRQEANDKRYAVLVDGRPYDLPSSKNINLENKNFEGAILDHPIYHEIEKESGQKGIPDSLAKIRVDLDLAGSTERAETFKPFFDPICKTDLGQKNYSLPSIVSTIPVKLAHSKFGNGTTQNNDGDDSLVSDPDKQVQTGLYVLVLQDFEDVLTDVRALERELGWLATLASIALLLVLASLGFFVNRLLKQSKTRLTRSFGAKSTVNIHDMPTLEK
jgi:hypothetical protein